MSALRVGVVATVVALLVPVELSAQRLPLPGTRRGPARPAPLPPQPEPVARPLAYKRLNYSIESYPLISYIQSPVSISGPTADWTSFGTGTRADYRLTRLLSATLDVTSSFAGGPANLFTVELGTRVRPQRSERRLYPFVDARLGYIRSYNTPFDAFEYAYPTTPAQGTFRYSSGVGGVVGLGMEYELTRRFSLTTAGSLMRNSMTTRAFFGADFGEERYTMTLYRYTIGLRYNPVRVIRQPGTDLR